MKNLTIKEYPSQERPMEKMVKLGVDSLSDIELLAILIGSGTREWNALDLANQILRTNKERPWLLKAGLEELQAYPGIGLTKSCRIIAGLELGRRLSQARDFNAISLSEPKTVANYFRSVYQGEDKEMFCTLFLDTKNRPVKMETVSLGILNQTLVHPREVFRTAIRQGAHSILLAHNHPSGDPEPSSEDLSITRRLIMAGKIIGIPVLDHVIVAESHYTSFRERGLLFTD